MMTQLFHVISLSKTMNVLPDFRSVVTPQKDTFLPSLAQAFLVVLTAFGIVIGFGNSVAAQCTAGCQTSGTIFDVTAATNQNFSGIGGPHAQMFQPQQNRGSVGGCDSGCDAGPGWGVSQNVPIVSGDCYGGGGASYGGGCDSPPSFGLGAGFGGGRGIGGRGFGMTGGNFGLNAGGRGLGSIAGGFNGGIPDPNRPHLGNRIGIGTGVAGARPNGLFGSEWLRTVTLFGGWNRIGDFLQTGTDNELFDDDLAVGIAIGRRHNKNFRSEFEFTFRTNDEVVLDDSAPRLLDQSADVYSIMKNFFVDFGNQNSRIRPYVGIGIGYSYLNTEFNSLSGIEVDGQSAFAWQPIGGVSMQLGAIAHAFVEYRYFGTADFDFTEFGSESLRDGSYGANNLFVGVRFEW